MILSNKDVDRQRAELAQKFPDGLFLLGLQVENVKRIKAVNLDFNAEGGLVVITGDNAQGKSSLLDALWYGFGGAGTLPPNPIRDGEKRAKIVLKIGDKEKPVFIVTRNLWYGKRGELKQNIEVKPAEPNSKPEGSPQTMLDALFELTSFDPLKFFNMKPPEQRETLLQIAGLQDELATIQIEYDNIFAERRDINRDAKQIEGELAGLDVPDGDTPEKEINITNLSVQVSAVSDKIAERGDCENAISTAQQLLKLQEQRVEELAAELEAAELKEEEIAKRFNEHRRRLAEFPDSLDKERAALTEDIIAAEDNNVKVRAAIKYNETVARFGVKSEVSNSKTILLSKIEERKLKLLEDATFPIKDIAVTGTGVMYQDLPLEQAAHSDQLRVSIALAIARHPHLRLIVSKEGDKLGKARRELLDEMAKASRHLVLIEKMSEDKSLGIYIEDGEIVEEEGNKPSE